METNVPHRHSHERSAESSRRLSIVLALTVVYMLAEVAGGWLTGSLALLADAGHMFTDAAALILALTAVWFASRPATPKKTFGYYRLEIIGNNGSKSYSVIRQVTIKPGMTRIILYPNPAANRINFSQTLSGIKVCNTAGQLVMPAIEKADVISIVALSEGFYYVRANEGVFRFEVKR